MIVKLYTLPNCGICHMVRTKLQNKNILFEEHDFQEIADVIHSDHAPALEVENNIYNSPTEIVQWINNYEE